MLIIQTLAKLEQRWSNLRRSPSVGIFWGVFIERKLFLITAKESLDEAEPYGDFISFSGGHYEIWEPLRRMSLSQLERANLPLAIHRTEYEMHTRGRLVLVANDINQRQGPVVILTPDSSHEVIRAALQTVQTKQQTYKNGGVTLGRIRIHGTKITKRPTRYWPISRCLNGRHVPTFARFLRLWSDTRHLAGHQPYGPFAPRARSSGFTAAQVTEFVRESERNRSRLGFRQQRRHLVMTIQRAKNRESPNAIVLWPHTATGSAEHLRRLLYNGITRAQNHCTVIVLGQGRMSAPPFSAAPSLKFIC